MNLYLIGIDHKKTPISMREEAHRQREAAREFWSGFAPAAILSTCNRFEIYVLGPDGFGAGVVMEMFKGRFAPLFDSAYIIYGREKIFRHLVRLASGLESQLRGELQIFSQVSAWLDKGLPGPLAGMVKDALLAAREVRVRNGLNRPENNLAGLVYGRISSEAYRDDLPDVTVAGTGKIAELFAAYKPHGVRLHFAAHKNIAKAKELARISGGNCLSLNDLQEFLLTTDVFVSATSSPHRIFDKDYFLKIGAKRTKDLYVYDLALPRDIDPEAGDIERIVLRNIDEVVIDADIKDRHAAQPVSR